MRELAMDVNVLAFAAIHIGALLVFWVGYTREWALLALFTYTLRMFGITAGYHRYFAHRSYRTSRAMQLILAVVGASALQKGVLWWASWHRHHHQTADTPEDAHTPQKGFWWSHFGWFLFSNEHSETLWKLIPDLARYPELRLVEQAHYVPAIALGAMCYAAFGVGGFVWGFLLSTTLLWHATFTINSLSHMYGSQRFHCEYHANCDARNNAWLAIITLGEGWHNNHHSAMRSVRQGFMWWEFDISYYFLCVLNAVGLVSGMRMPPYKELEARRILRSSSEIVGPGSRARNNSKNRCESCPRSDSLVAGSSQNLVLKEPTMEQICDVELSNSSDRS